MPNQSTSRRTQLVSTIGPASESEAVLKEMIKAGMNIARFNTKHNEPEWHRDTIRKVRAVAQEMGTTIPVLLDLQGPEVRTELPNNQEFTAQTAETVVFTSDTTQTGTHIVFVPQMVVTSMNVGDHILLEDGACDFVVCEKNEKSLETQTIETCVVKPRKTVNTPGVVLEMPSLTERDLKYMDAAKDENPDYVGISFVRDKKDIDIIRAAMAERGMNGKIIAKIEHQKAIDNIDELIRESDAIMVARGDMGVEVPYYEVPHHQKVIVRKCNEAGKFVIVATQMLLSMMTKIRPTRAEVTDVATAVYDGANAVMLSEESAMGNFPIKAVETQAKIVAYHEQFV